MTETQSTALKNMLFCLADDDFILGHRLSEWTGLGPIIEEDIAASSIAQDELGHALAYYSMLEELGEADPDELAFQRGPGEFRNAQFSELPRGDYGFTMMRQFLYDGAKSERLQGLRESSFEPLQDIAAKILQEERYHWVHNTSMVHRLSGGTEESIIRMQDALDELFPYALGLFESYDGENELVEAGITLSEKEIQQRWLNKLCPMLQVYGLRIPCVKVGEDWKSDLLPKSGGRKGKHTEHLTGILDAMQTLHKAHPGAQW
jgi:ring-1,2-phenylacetyl-CoA epoxidase subunit PaaC